MLSAWKPPAAGGGFGRGDEPTIVLFTDCLGRGGAQRQMLLLLDELVRRGHDIRILTYEPTLHYELSAEAAARITCVDKGGRGMQPHFPYRLHRALRGLGADVVVSFLRGPSIWIGLTRALFGRRFAWVVSERSSQLDLEPRGRRKAYEACLRRADRVCPNGETAADEVRAVLGRGDLVRVIPNGIVLGAPPPHPRPSDGPLQIVHVSSISPNKNQERMARALLSLGPQRDWHLHLVGRVADAAVGDRVAELARSSGGRITLHGEQRQVEPYFRRADLCVLPSGFEGFPNVVLEAWAQQCPVLVSDRGDLPRIVEHGRTGWVFSLDSPDDLSRRLSAILDMPRGRLAAVGRAGREHVEQTYQFDRIADAWWTVLSDLAR